MIEHPPVHYFASLEDLDRSLVNPKLTALLSDGYVIEASTLVSAEQGTGLALVLVHRPSVLTIAPPVWRQLAAVVGVVAILSGLAGAGLVLVLGG